MLTLGRAAVAITVPLALSTVAGCGSDSSPETATDQHASGSTATPSGTPTPAAPKKMSSAAFLAAMKNAAGQISTARFRMRMDEAGQSIPISGVIDMTGDSPAMRMSIDVSGMGTPSDMRLVDKVVYVQVPGTAGKFYKLDLRDPNGPLGSLGGTLDNLNPGSIMSGLAPGMFDHVVDHGVTNVAGRPLHHYTATVDVRAESNLVKLPNFPKASLPKSATYDVWLDDHGRMAKYRMVMPKFMTMNASYSDYGTAPRVTAPPAADVMDLPSSAAYS